MANERISKSTNRRIIHHAPVQSLPWGRFTLHLPFLLILLLHFGLSLTYASQVPLGEAPDEPAHLSYAQFIARNARLPATLAERREAGYRSAWPPLYHLLVAGPLAAIGDEPPTRLKAVGDTPRRLIPTDGQTIAAYIHTADESRPWRGLPLAWHLGRLLSVALTALAVTLTYAIAQRLTGQHLLAASAAALHAFMPQVLFIGAAVNDDNLLICLSGLIFLTLINYPARPSPGRAFWLGALLGLATVTKYNALPVWALVIIWACWRNMYKRRIELSQSPISNLRTSPRSTILPILRSSILPFFLGVLLTAGWWFIFIWLNFNQVDALGLLPGSLAALTAGSSDASLRQLATPATSFTFPAPATWLEWFSTLFETFWGSFGGGSTIDLPAWVYGLLSLLCLLAIISGSGGQKLRVRGWGPEIKRHASRLTPHASRLTPHASRTPLFLLSPLLFLPLPLLRFILSGSIVETAQGRHLFPALPAIALGLVWGLSRLTFNFQPFTPHASRLTFHVSRFSLPFLALLLSLYSLKLIQTSYPPPIPLRTTADAATAANLLPTKLAEGVNLLGYDLGQAAPGILPVTLVWQATTVPADDYLIELALTDQTGQPLGGWFGHPLGGRYPTRAWDKGDVLRHTIPIPLLPNLPATTATLSLRLLDSLGQPASPPLSLISKLDLAPTPLLLRSPAQLRTDDLPPDSPFTYRSTLSFVLPDSTPPELVAPTGQTFPPDRVISNTSGSIAHFVVAANWPSGEYQWSIVNGQWSIVNRLRQFDLPRMEHTLNANFADTLTLLGYDLPQRRVQPGESFPITLHWRAERPIGQNLIVFNHLLDANASQHGGADRVPQLYYTTLLWVPGEIVSDAYDVPVVAAAPPGVYWLDVGLYPSAQPTFSLPLFENGQPLDRNSVRLGPLKVGGPPPGVTVVASQSEESINLSFGGQITLLGYSPAELRIDNCQLSITLYWRADTIPPADYTVFIHLLDPQGNLAAQFDSPPAAGAYPTSLWDPGEIIADAHRLSDLPPGRYTLQIGLYRPDTGERLPVPDSPDGAVKLTEIEVGK